MNKFWNDVAVNTHTNRVEPIDKTHRAIPKKSGGAGHGQGRIDIDAKPISDKNKKDKRMQQRIIHRRSHSDSNSHRIMYREFRESLKVCGNKNNIGLPAMNDRHSESFGSFVLAVKEKYKHLYDLLDQSGNHLITIDQIYEFLKKFSVRSTRSLAKDVMSVFDPFNAGVITKQFFYGVLVMHEFSAYGLTLSLPRALVDLTNLRHIHALKSQVNRLKTLFSRYSDGKFIRKENFLELVSPKAGKNIEHFLKLLDISSKVNFAQFLLSLPVLFC